MAAKRILTVGFELASADTKYFGLDSKTSLLDWDIVLLRSDISQFISYHEEFQGKPRLSDGVSFQLKDCCGHWRREIKQAFDTGKTVIVFLSDLQEVFVDTGQRSYSGTGRNQRTTRHVAEYDNYQIIPATLSPVATTGVSIKLSGRAPEGLAPYWTEFGSISQYKVILADPKVPASFVTKTGDKPVGAIYRSKLSSGILLLLPDIDFDKEEFVKERDGNQVWTAAARQFAGRMVSAVVAFDTALRTNTEITPEPLWATSSEFVLKNESSLRSQLLDAEQKVEDAQRHKEQLAGQLSSAGLYRALLFEKGKPLEKIIIESLRLLGFTAAPFKDSDSEFDVVFECDEGRLIGEAEGKDNKAINIDKLRQLSMNIHEDLQRESVATSAKPVLFGNGFRLQPLSDRANPFTEKCESAAATTSTALVFTPDLFRVIQYILSNPDAEYARECRHSLLTSSGRVAFPPCPATEQTIVETQVKGAE
jgi:hypothetical protein